MKARPIHRELTSSHWGAYEVLREGERAVGLKWAGHQINQVNFIRPKRTMSQIGG